MLLNQKDSLLVLVDVQEKLTPFVLDSDLLIAKCEWLLKLAVRLQVPILISEQYPQGLGATLAALQSYGNDTFTKVHFSCMQEPGFLTSLKAQNKKQLVLIGIEAHVCVLQTALDMKEQGFEVYVVVDAVSSRHENDLKYGLKRMKQEGVHLITS